MQREKNEKFESGKFSTSRLCLLILISRSTYIFSFREHAKQVTEHIRMLLLHTQNHEPNKEQLKLMRNMKIMFNFVCSRVGNLSKG